MSEGKTNSAKRDVLNYVGIVAIIILLNYVLSFFFGRFDLTEDKRYSLSENTIALLEDDERMKDRVYLKIYLDGDLPADIKKIRNSIREKLDEFKVYAGDKIQYEFIDPNGEDDEDYNIEVQKNIYSEGISPTDIQIAQSGKVEVKTIWPGALIDYKGTTVDQIQFFNKRLIASNEDARGLADRTINNLEYKLISAIRRVTADDKQTIGFLQGHDELDEWQTADVRQGLDRYYLVEDVEINGQIGALDNVDALVVAQPKKPFNEKDKFVIDQFIMNGGRVLWFIDPLEINRDSLYYRGETWGISANLNIEKDMLYKYGARLNNNTLIDKDCGPIYIPGHPLGIVDWYFYPLLQRTDHPITKNIDPIKSEYASTVEIVNQGDADVQKTVLLKSSGNSLAFKSRVRINYSIVDVEPNFNENGETDLPVALMMEGRFTSAFENRLTQEFTASPDFKTRFKSDSTKMLVVSDGDIIRNEVETKVIDGETRYRAIPLNVDRFGVQNPNRTSKYIYGNRDFVLNSIDYMMDDNSLIDVRAKTITLRVLDTQKAYEEKSFWKILNIGFPLLCIFILGLVQFFLRKKKFAKTV
ncbi:gliding motility-associated ABC transporter substrate-binding protein GldG [Crocinitomicaceae bacterium]|nr:gliding motility-associated ABC transporter substrate-binding protein GldG [Crocinitomicaceae bacterium]